MCAVGIRAFLVDAVKDVDAIRQCRKDQLVREPLNGRANEGVLSETTAYAFETNEDKHNHNTHTFRFIGEDPNGGLEC